MGDDILGLTVVIEAELGELRRRLERGIVPLLARSEAIRAGDPIQPAFPPPPPSGDGEGGGGPARMKGGARGEKAARSEVLAMLSKGDMTGMRLRLALARKGHAAADVSAAIMHLRRVGAVGRDGVCGALQATRAGRRAKGRG